MRSPDTDDRTNVFVATIRSAIQEIVEHGHPHPKDEPDLYCLCRKSWLGYRMVGMLSLYDEARAEIGRLRGRERALVELTERLADALGDADPDGAERILAGTAETAA